MRMQPDPSAARGRTSALELGERGFEGRGSRPPGTDVVIRERFLARGSLLHGDEWTG